MDAQGMDRKRRFRAAAELVGGYGRACAEIHYSENHVGKVLNGRLDSPAVTAAVDEFIAKHLAAAVAAA